MRGRGRSRSHTTSKVPLPASKCLVHSPHSDQLEHTSSSYGIPVIASHCNHATAKHPQNDNYSCYCNKPTTNTTAPTTIFPYHPLYILPCIGRHREPLVRRCRCGILGHADTRIVLPGCHGHWALGDGLQHISLSTRITQCVLKPRWCICVAFVGGW